MLICTVLLNSFSVIASGEELVKTETTGRLAWSLKLRQKQRLIQRRIHLLLQKKIPLKEIVLLQAQKKESLDSSTNSTTEEHSSVSETNTTDSKTEASQSSEVEKRPLTKMKRIIKKQHVKERTIKRNICYEKRPFF